MAERSNSSQIVLVPRLANFLLLFIVQIFNSRLSFLWDKSFATGSRRVGERSGAEAASSERVQQNFILKGPQERAGFQPACSSLTSLHLLLTVISPSSHSSTHSFTQPSIHLSVLPIQTSVLLLRPLTRFTVQCLHTHTHAHARGGGQSWKESCEHVYRAALSIKPDGTHFTAW